jgi:hypothetical protein
VFDVKKNNEMKKFTFNFVFFIFPTLLTAPEYESYGSRQKNAISTYTCVMHPESMPKPENVRYGLVKEKQNLLKSHCAKQAQKQLLRNREQPKQMVLRSRKETENLHKIIMLLR